MEMPPHPQKVSCQAITAAIMAIAGSMPAGADEKGDSLFIHPPAVFFQGRETSTGEGSRWATYSARYRSQYLKTEVGLHWSEYRENALQPLPEGETPPGPGPLGSDAGPHSGPGVAYIPPGSAPNQAAAPRNDLDSIAGQIAKVRLSAARSLPATALWDSATIRLDIGRQRLANAPRNPAAFDPGSNRHSRAIQLQFTPSWSEVLPNLELSLPIALSYSPKAQAPLPGLKRIEDATERHAEKAQTWDDLRGVAALIVAGSRTK